MTFLKVDRYSNTSNFKKDNLHNAERAQIYKGSVLYLLVYMIVFQIITDHRWTSQKLKILNIIINLKFQQNKSYLMFCNSSYDSITFLFSF